MEEQSPWFNVGFDVGFNVERPLVFLLVSFCIFEALASIITPLLKVNSKSGFSAAINRQFEPALPT